MPPGKTLTSVEENDAWFSLAAPANQCGVENDAYAGRLRPHGRQMGRGRLRVVRSEIISRSC
jgi:hypothetical protein